MYLDGINLMNGLTGYGLSGLGGLSGMTAGLNFADAFQRAVSNTAKTSSLAKTSSSVKTSSSMINSSLAKASSQVKSSSSAKTLASAEMKLHGNADAGTGEQIVGSFINVQAGTSSAIYKPEDFDASNPVYHVKTWDMEGNMTERTVDLSKFNPRNCDDVDMYTFSWHLNNSGQYPQAQLKFAAARAYQQSMQGNSLWSYLPTQTNWVNVINSLMLTQYNAGNFQGYLDYNKFLGFLS